MRNKWKNGKLSGQRKLKLNSNRVNPYREKDAKQSTEIIKIQTPTPKKLNKCTEKDNALM